MIPLAYIQAWSQHAPWPDLRQVEQDLIIARALCDLFTSSALKDRIAFRGGTAINKLLFEQPLRYSEDIGLVQTRAEPIGDTVNAVREALSWLGTNPKRQQAQHSMHLIYRFAPEVNPSEVLNLKGRDQHARTCKPLRTRRDAVRHAQRLAQHRGQRRHIRA